RSRSSSRTGIIADEEEKHHKYIIQAVLLRKSWPLTPTQWQFVEQLKEQEKNELKIFNRQPSPSATRPDATKRANQNQSGAATGGAKQTKGGKPTGATTARPSTAKTATSVQVDITKPHWTLRVVSDADKGEELNLKKDTERMEELINTKKAWETYEAGRAQKSETDEQKLPDGDEQQKDIVSPTEPVKKAQDKKAETETTVKTGKGAAKKVKEETIKPPEVISEQPPPPPIDEPLLDEPPPQKPKIILPPLDIKHYLRHKTSSEEPITISHFFEQEELRRRQQEFQLYAQFAEELHNVREEDNTNRYKEKIRQLEEYVDLQAKIDTSRKQINEPREAFRQRFLEAERLRLAELAAQEAALAAQAAEKKDVKGAKKGGKGSAGKGKKK
ncbi:unnamed protein product, partial [Didymodactylos carnosus]